MFNDSHTVRLGSRVVLQLQPGALEAIVSGQPLLVVVAARDDAAEIQALDRQASSLAGTPIRERRELTPEERLRLVLEQGGPKTIGQLAQASGVTKDVARLVMKPLRRDGEVTSSGQGRSTAYELRRGKGRSKATATPTGKRGRRIHKGGKR